MRTEASQTPDQRFPSLPLPIENALVRENRVSEIAHDLHARATELLEDYGVPDGWFRKEDKSLQQEATYNYLKTPPITMEASDGTRYQIWLTQQTWEEDEEGKIRTTADSSVSVKVMREGAYPESWSNEGVVGTFYKLPGAAIFNQNERKIEDVEAAEEVETVIAELERIMAEKLEKTDEERVLPLDYPKLVNVHSAVSR